LRLEGRRAQLFVRPYDLEIHAQPNGAGALRAQVKRVQLAGPVVRVELQSDDQQLVQVELSHDRFRQQPVAVGNEVFVTPRDSRVFIEDYSI
jgi:sulfate transport system ATP-binding protein